MAINEYHRLQMHCTENSNQIFPKMKLCGLVPNFHIHVSVGDLYIPTIGPQTQYSEIGGPIVRIYKLHYITSIYSRKHS
jgi:hypothetical protein